MKAMHHQHPFFMFRDSRMKAERLETPVKTQAEVLSAFALLHRRRRWGVSFIVGESLPYPYQKFIDLSLNLLSDFLTMACGLQCI